MRGNDEDASPLFFNPAIGLCDDYLCEGLVAPAWARRRKVRPAYLPLLKMTQGAYRQTMAALGSRSPEAAGILLGPKEDEPFATHFVLDTCGIATSVSFRLDVEHLNKVLARFRQCDLTCVGIVHSHPTGIQAPSHGDLEYVERVLGHEDNDETSVFLFPIFCDGRLHPYILCRTKSLPRIAPAALMLV